MFTLTTISTFKLWNIPCTPEGSPVALLFKSAPTLSQSKPYSDPYHHRIVYLVLELRADGLVTVTVWGLVSVTGKPA